MTIIKNKLTQSILIGFLFAFILGTLSFVVHNSLVSEPIITEKQTIIIDNKDNNQIQKNLINLNKLSYGNKIIILTQELFQSILYTKVRYENDERLSYGCTNLSMNLTDNSIFIETSSYPIKNRKNYVNCLENLFKLSFERIKNKFFFLNYQELSETETSLSNEKENKDNLNKDQLLLNKSYKNCSQLEISYNKLIEKFNSILENDNKISNEKNNYLEEYIKIFNFHQNLLAARSLSEFCNKNFNNNYLQSRNEYIFYLDKLNDAIKNSTLNEVFEVDKIFHSHNPASSQYLSLKNIIITFSFFGFIFGVLLFNNFGILKNKNE